MSKTWAKIFIVAVSVISVLFALTLPSTRFDYDFEKFFKPDDQATQYFNEHRETFGTDNDFVLIGIVSEDGVFNTRFQETIGKLTEECRKLPHVIDIISPNTLKTFVRDPLLGALSERKVLRGDAVRDSLRVFSDPSLVDNLFSSDTSAISIVIITEDKLSKNKCDELATSITSLMSDYDFDAVHIAGRAIGQVVYIKKIQSEFSLFMAISLGFIIVLLFIMFRSIRGIVLPLFTVLLAVLWSIGILNLTGKGISILLNMLPPVIFVVGMSDAVHLYARYLEELKKGAAKKLAIKEMIFDTGLATFFTSVTTSIGFASLYFTGIPALQEFGVITALGVMAAFVIAITLLPAWLVLTPESEKTLLAKGHNHWNYLLSKAFEPIMRNKKWIYAGTVLLALSFAAIASQLQLNNFILEDLKPSEPLRQDFTFFDQNFAGVRPFEIGITPINQTDTLLSKSSLLAIAKIESYLKLTYGVRAIISPTTAVRELYRMRHAGRNEYYRLPDSKDDTDWKRMDTDLKQMVNSGKLRPVINIDLNYARISGRIGDLGAKAFAEKNAAFSEWIIENDLDKSMDIQVTGTGTLIDRTNQNLVGSLAKGLGVAFGLIAILMGFLFRSFKMVLIALIPNLLPLLAVGAVMALSGIDLKMSTSIIFTIAFGIAVDDTIHLLSRYRLEIRKGATAEVALRNAYIHTGKAIIITSIILFGGFISLCFSSFQSTYYIGLLVTLTLFFALVFDLTILPALLVRRDHKPSI